MSWKNRWQAAIGPLVLLLVIFLGPHCIHLVYHLATSDEAIATRRLDYAELADEESHLPPVAQEASIKKRQALHRWFHARGLDIDEDPKAQSIWEPWKELMEYWRKGSN